MVEMQMSGYTVKVDDKMAIKLHGEFAITNFPKNNYIKGATN